MDKKTQMWIGVAAIAGIALYIYNKNKKTSTGGFANFAQGAKLASGCKVYPGSCGVGVGFVITEWENGGVGIVVASNSTRCLVCPISNTNNGLPKEF